MTMQEMMDQMSGDMSEEDMSAMVKALSNSNMPAADKQKVARRMMSKMRGMGMDVPGSVVTMANG